MEGKKLEQMQIKCDCSGEQRGKDKTVFFGSNEKLTTVPLLSCVDEWEGSER
jgi:hypothetical protein